jgi:hypothetical protein
MTRDGYVIEVADGVPSVSLKYPAPALTAVQRCNAPATGGAVLVLLGQNFGTVDSNPRLPGSGRQRVAQVGGRAGMGLKEAGLCDRM